MPAPFGLWQPAQAGTLFFSDTAAIDLFAQGQRILVLGSARFGWLRIQVSRDVFHFIVGQQLGQRRHDRIIAVGALEIGQLLVDVCLVLAAQFSGWR